MCLRDGIDLLYIKAQTHMDGQDEQDKNRLGLSRIKTPSARSIPIRINRIRSQSRIKNDQD